MNRILLQGALIVALPLLALGCKTKPSVLGGSDATVPKPGEPTYKDAVSAFFASVVAVQVNDGDNRIKFTEKATQLAPGEPAAWANKALSELRAGHPEEADVSLKKAETLAPNNAEIQVLRGLIFEAQGKFDESAKAFQQAAKTDPDNVEALYYLAQAADRAKGPDEWKIKKEAYEAILKRRPGNVAALLSLIEALVGAQDKAGIQKYLPELLARTTVWPKEARTALETFAKDLPTLSGRELMIGFRSMMGYARPTNEYTLGLRDLGKPTFLGSAVQGNPITKPLKLVAPSPEAAAPDTALSYAPEPLGSAPATATLAIALDDTGAPAVLTSLPGFPGATGLVALDVNDEVGAMEKDGLPREFLLDIAAVGPGGLRLYKNSKSGLTDATAASGLPPSVTGAPATGIWSVDFEADGDMDLIASPAKGEPLVLQNNGNGKFALLPGKLKGVAGPLKDLAWADFDGDGDPDLALIDASGALRLLSNERGGLFLLAKEAPAASSLVGLAVAEINDDTNLDLLVLDASGGVQALAFADGKWAAPASLTKSGAAKPARLLVEDLDNNGGVDLVVAGDGKSEIFLREPGGKFSTSPLTAPLAVDSVVDLTKDGVVDLVGRTGGKAMKAIAKPTKKYGYQVFTLKAKHPGDELSNKINAYAVGGELEVRAGLWYRKLALTGPQLHIGLGEAEHPDYARVVWPNGNPQGEFDFTKKVLVADQRLGGSCPFLFAWNGKEFAFVTDCIWRSPLGLKINAQATAGVNQTEDWVKIAREQLAAKDGFYDLRITAELRETHFFDHLSLMSVDHADGTEIWVDERFSPMEKPKLEVIPTRPAQALASVAGFDGKDVGKTLAERDGEYLDDFGRGPYQGVTKDHWVEVSIPESAPKNVPLYLIAFGWLHPTDSSINVALSQNASQAPPQGLSIWTPDASGSWKLARPGLGFPEGKLKTVVLRIDDAFQPGAARKVRLRTNLEVYWDQIRWAEGVKTPLKLQKLKATTADLNYRGFSEVVAKDVHSPELPTSYASLTGGAPRWRDLTGCYTRFGTVGPLLSAIDDRYVIMNAGDELRLRFAEPAPPAAGQRRDFVLIGDGWVKDGNVNTEWGQTVHPLPAHARTSYPRPGALADDPVYKAHRDDFLEYHTRYVTDEMFTEALRP